MSQANVNFGSSNVGGGIEIFYVNATGGGFATKHQVTAGTKLVEFLNGAGLTGNSSQYQIRVNRNIVDVNYVLQNGDRVTVTPLQVKGA